MRGETTVNAREGAQVKPLFGKSDNVSPKAWVTRFLPGRSAGTLAREPYMRSATGQAPGLSSAWSKARQPMGRVVASAAASAPTAAVPGTGEHGWQAEPSYVERLQSELANELERKAQRDAVSAPRFGDADWQAEPAEVERLQGELANELERIAERNAAGSSADDH